MTAAHPGGDQRLCRASLSVLLLTGCLTMTVTASNCPKILEPKNDTISTTVGGHCTIPCTARTRFPHFCLVFWMVNERFIEDVYPEGRVREERQSINQHNNKYRVGRPLVFTTIQAEDFTQTFTCVIQDPSGFRVKNITLVEAGREAPTEIVPKHEDQKEEHVEEAKQKNGHTFRPSPTDQSAVDPDLEQTL